ncbi:MAG: ChaN family lipoprotein [Terracidiphilus sp.]
MASSSLRIRQQVQQIQALAKIQRDIRVQDPNSRSKYLREFHRAFRSYEAILTQSDVHQAITGADIILVGDYHALPASQRFASELLEHRAHKGDRPVVLGVESIFSRDQGILDRWWRREISGPELRRRIEFDEEWGYEWDPFHELLVTARDCADGIYALDCAPRGDMRKIRGRDRHAANRFAEIRELHPSAAIFALFGESHLAPTHLPRDLQEIIPNDGVLTILQNVDALYWAAAETESEVPEAIRVHEGVLCVFHTSLLDKYASYRKHLQRWSEGEEELDAET